MMLDAKIADSFNKMNERLNKRLHKLNSAEWFPNLDWRIRIFYYSVKSIFLNLQ